MSELSVSAPASSANLGAGFDAAALALELRMTARVRVLPRGASPSWTYAGACAPTHDGIRTCIERALRRVAPDAPALAVELHNEIPLGAGLGSSAAAYAIGASIGVRLAAGRDAHAAAADGRSPDGGDVDDAEDGVGDDDVGERIARVVVELEGHPDNALAACLGGTIVVAHGEDGVSYARFAPLAAAAVVVVPEIVLPTAEARALLPASYSRADAVHSVQRAALLGAALAAGRLDLLRAAVRDRLHQPYRAGAIPGLEEMLRLDDPAVVAIALSGAGPSVFALVRAEPERIGARLAEIFRHHGVASRILVPRLAGSGIVTTFSDGV